jgi:hypothetical protein
MSRQHRTESVNLLYCIIVTQYNTLHETISHDPQREVTHVTQLRAAQRLVASRRHVAAGAAQASSPLSKVAHIAQLHVARYARGSVHGAGLARLAHGCSLFPGRISCNV